MKKLSALLLLSVPTVLAAWEPVTTFIFGEPKPAETINNKREDKILEIKRKELLAKQAKACAEINRRMGFGYSIWSHKGSDGTYKEISTVPVSNDVRNKCNDFLEFFAKSLEIPEEKKS